MKELNDNLTIEKITKGMMFHGGEPYATSLDIAKHFGIEHNDLLKKIRAFHSFDSLILLGKISQRKRFSRGREYPFFELDADAFVFTCLSITGKKAETLKWAFIQAFKQAARSAISAIIAIQCNKANDLWIEARNNGKSTRKMLSEKIKEFCMYAEQQRGRPYGKDCPYFKIITDAIYDHLGIETQIGGKAPRDTLAGDRLEAIQNSETLVINFLKEIIATNGTRKKLKTRIIERLNQRRIH